MDLEREEEKIQKENLLSLLSQELKKTRCWKMRKRQSFHQTSFTGTNRSELKNDQYIIILPKKNINDF